MENHTPAINVSTADKVRTIEICNPRKRNAMTHRMARSLLQALRTADRDPGTRVVILCGAGDLAFSSGHDLDEASMFDEEGDGDLAFEYPAQMGTPVIAAVSGHCHGAGLILALSCDIRLADRTARFRSPGAAFGMLPMGGQIALLPRMMSPGRASLFLMSACLLEGQDAADWGLVDLLVPDGDVKARARELAKAIASNSPGTIATIKSGIAKLADEEPAARMAWEQRQVARLAVLPDAAEGVAAARARRDPDFSDIEQPVASN